MESMWSMESVAKEGGAEINRNNYARDKPSIYITMDWINTTQCIQEALKGDTITSRHLESYTLGRCEPRSPVRQPPRGRKRLHRNSPRRGSLLRTDSSPSKALGGFRTRCKAPRYLNIIILSLLYAFSYTSISKVSMFVP